MSINDVFAGQGQRRRPYNMASILELIAGS
jgi:hypothetical protein